MPKRAKEIDTSLFGYSARDFRRMGYEDWELPSLFNIRLFRRKK